MKSSYWRTFAMIAALLMSAQASAQVYSYIDLPYKIDLRHMQGVLALGTHDPTRSIQQATSALMWNGGSNHRWDYQGVTEVRDCSNARSLGFSVITATTTGSSIHRRATVTNCGANIFIITVPSGGAKWVTLALNNGNPEVAGSVLGGLAQVAGSSTSGRTDCISDVGATSDTLILSRNVFCKVEIEAIASAAGAMTTGVTSGIYRAPISSQSAWATSTPVASDWSAGAFPNNFGAVDAGMGVGGSDLDFSLDNNLNPVEMTYSSPVLGTYEDVYATAPGFGYIDYQVWGTPSFRGFVRRPTFAYDPTRNVTLSILPQGEDGVALMLAQNSLSWNAGTASILRQNPDGSRFSTPISTKMPVAASYSPTLDRFVIAWVQFSGSTSRTTVIDPTADLNTPLAGAVNLTVLPAVISPLGPPYVQFDAAPNWPSSFSNVLRADQANDGSLTHVYASTPPSLACSVFQCTSTSTPRNDCVGVFSDLEPTTPDTRALGTFGYQQSTINVSAEPYGYGYSYRPGLADSVVQLGTPVGMPPAIVGGASDYPPSGDVAHHYQLFFGSPPGYTGSFLVALKGVDNYIYVTTLPQNRGVGANYECSGGTVNHGPAWTSYYSFSTQVTQTPMVHWREGSGAAHTINMGWEMLLGR